MAQRWSRRRVTVVAGVCAAILLAGAVIVRLDSGEPSAGDDAASTVLVATSTSPSLPAPPPVDSAPTAAATTAPGLGERGDVEVPIDPCGARSDQSEAGARQAAVDYLVTVRQQLVYLTPESGTDVLTAWAAPGVSSDVIVHDVEESTAIRQRLAEDGGDIWWVVAPLAIRVDAYSSGRARVAVWLTSLIASGADPAVSSEATQPMVRYQTDTVELVWDQGRWTVWSTTSADGPTPMLAPSLPIATPDVFLSSLDGFGLIRRHLG